jgi:MYXO-CTERM domain-containing protein
MPSLAAPLLLAALSPAGAYDLDEIPLTRWPDEFRPVPVDTSDLPVPMPEDPLELRTIEAREPPVGTPPAGLQGRVVVLVESGLAAPLEDALDAFIQDLTLEGHPVLLESALAGSGAELKDHLRDLYAEEDGLEGAVLIGELPFLRYEFQNDYGHYGYAVFPCDLALTDLDGTWTDSNSNGILDGHSNANAAPEIWVGRMIVRSNLGDREQVLEDYFARDHEFRRGGIQPQGTALVYVDDDWAHWTGEFEREVEGGFGDVTAVGSTSVTRTADYIPRLTQDYDNIAVFVHSSPQEHYFVYQGAYDTMSWTQIPDDATALFYDLFACSNSNFDDDPVLGTGSPIYMGGVYAFGTEFGLLALGSTKTGSMLERPGYYDRLGDYESFGAALRGWWEEVQPYDTNQRENWYYGLTHLGDPSLRVGYPTVGVDVEQIVIDEAEAAPVSVEIALSNTGFDRYHWGLALEEGAIEDQPWIQPTATVGVVSDRAVTLTLTFDPLLAEGVDASQTLLIRAPGATNNPVAIPLEIVRWGTPALCVDPDPVEVRLAGPDARKELSLAVGNCNPGPVTWEASASDSWLHLDADSGEAADGPDTVTLTFGGRALERDTTYEGVLTISSPEEGVLPVEVPVTLRVGSAGCGCASGAGRPAWPGLALIGLAPLLRRRQGRSVVGA